MIRCSASSLPSRVSTFSNTGGSTGTSGFFSGFGFGFFSLAAAPSVFALPLPPPLVSLPAAAFFAAVLGVPALSVDFFFADFCPSCFLALPLPLGLTSAGPSMSLSSELSERVKTCDGRDFLVVLSGRGPLATSGKVGGGVKLELELAAVAGFLLAAEPLVFLATAGDALALACGLSFPLPLVD